MAVFVFGVSKLKLGLITMHYNFYSVSDESFFFFFFFCTLFSRPFYCKPSSAYPQTNEGITVSP